MFRGDRVSENPRKCIKPLKRGCLHPVACIRSGSGVSVVRPKCVADNLNKIVNNY
jgi:hypothetical protein